MSTNDCSEIDKVKLKFIFQESGIFGRDSVTKNQIFHRQGSFLFSSEHSVLLFIIHLYKVSNQCLASNIINGSSKQIRKEKWKFLIFWEMLKSGGEMYCQKLWTNPINQNPWNRLLIGGSSGLLTLPSRVTKVCYG